MQHEQQRLVVATLEEALFNRTNEQYREKGLALSRKSRADHSG